MTYDPRYDRAWLAIRAAQRATGARPSWGTPPAHWPARQRWIRCLVDSIEARLRAMAYRPALHAMAAAQYRKAMTFARASSDPYTARMAEHAALHSVFEAAKAVEASVMHAAAAVDVDAMRRALR